MTEVKERERKVTPAQSLYCNWTKDEYNNLVRSLKLTGVINFDWSYMKNEKLHRIVLNMINTKDYPEFRKFIEDELLQDSVFVNDILFEYNAAYSWMTETGCIYQPVQYLQRVFFTLHKDKTDAFIEKYGKDAVPDDFRTINPLTYSEEGNSVKSYIDDVLFYKRPPNRKAEAKEKFHIAFAIISLLSFALGFMFLWEWLFCKVL